MLNDKTIITEEPQVAVVANYTLIAEIYSIAFFAVHYLLGQWFLTWIYAISAIVIGLNYFILKKTKNHKRALSVIFSVGTLVITSIFGTGGFENTGYLWIFPYMTFVFFLSKNLNDGILWTLLLTCTCSIIVLFHWLGLFQLPYSYSFLLHLFLSFFVMVALSIIFHKARVNYEDFLSYTKRLMETAIDPIIVIGADGNIINTNKAMMSITGISQESLLNTQLLLYFENKEKVKELIEDIFQKKSAQNIPMVMIARNKALNVLCTASVYQEGKIQQQGLIFLKDITDIANAEHMAKEYANGLEKKNKELDQFAYIVSHDLKAPLRAIANLSEWIKEDLGTNLSDDNRNNINLLQGRVRRMQNLITGILEYSKIGRIKVVPEELHVNHLLTEVIDLLSPPEKFKITVQPDMPSLKTEKILLQQVFANLISNAIKYNDKPTGAINISAAKLEEFYEFTVADNGPGIASEHHDKVFGIFQTLEAKDKVESTGIGLSIVKKIIDEHGGGIRIDSQHRDGAKFIFTWPNIHK